jgi:hypothetical protein
MALVFATEFGSPLGMLEQKRSGIESLLKKEFHPKRIQGLLDQLDGINREIRKEKRKFHL